jgi:hypothetical protein
MAARFQLLPTLLLQPYQQAVSAPRKASPSPGTPVRDIQV